MAGETMQAGNSFLQPKRKTFTPCAESMAPHKCKPMTDDLNLHDEAAEAAERAVADLRSLSAEGIPRRIARIRAELFTVLEAAWLTGGVQFEALRNPSFTQEDARKTSLQMHQMTAQVEATLHLVMKGLEPLLAERCGDDFDLLLDSALENMSAEWVRDFFVGVYADKERDEKVLRLNALLHKKRDPKKEQNND